MKFGAKSQPRAPRRITLSSYCWPPPPPFPSPFSFSLEPPTQPSPISTYLFTSISGRASIHLAEWKRSRNASLNSSMYTRRKKKERKQTRKKERERGKKERNRGHAWLSFVVVYLEDFTRENTTTTDDQTIVASVEQVRVDSTDCISLVFEHESKWNQALVVARSYT